MPHVARSLETMVRMRTNASFVVSKTKTMVSLEFQKLWLYCILGLLNHGFEIHVLASKHDMVSFFLI